MYQQIFGYHGENLKFGLFVTQLKLQVDRTGTRVTVVEQKEKKDYSFQANILELVLDCLEKGVVPTPEV